MFNLSNRDEEADLRCDTKKKKRNCPFCQMPAISAIGISLFYFCAGTITLFTCYLAVVVSRQSGDPCTNQIYTYLLNCLVVCVMFYLFGWWKGPFTITRLDYKTEQLIDFEKKDYRAPGRILWKMRFSAGSSEQQRMLKNYKLYLVVILMAAAALIPILWIEGLCIEQDEDYTSIYEQMMANPLGLIALVFACPLADEVVMHGAMLRKLLKSINQKRDLHEGVTGMYEDNPPRWKTALGIATCIVIPATCYCVMNLVDIYIFFALTIAGWLYYKVGNIIPCVLFRAVLELGSGVLIFLDMNLMRHQLIDVLHGDYLLLCAVLTGSVLTFALCVYLIQTRIRRQG